MAMAAQRPRTIKKIEKPKPLKIQRTMPMMDNRIVTTAVSPFAFNDIVSLVDSVAMMLENGYSNGMYDQNIQATIVTMCNHLKLYSHDLEKMFKDQLDRAFIAIRNASVDTRLDTTTRVHLLELIELRAKQWHNNDNMNAYYSQKLSNLDMPETTVLISSPLTTPVSTGSPPLLGPGEVLKSSGKFAKPTRIPGKNYCKDEVVIRNSDSGKVMGIKGRRVHMIEELSETTISFQRVNPGAKERLVQITGTSEDKIYYAKDLIKDTIHRNASPIRRGSSTSINSSESDDSNPIQTVSSVHSALSRSYSTNDANNIEEFKYTHTVKVGNDSVTITGTNIDLVEAAKVALDNYFSEGYDHRGDYFNYDEENAFTPLTPNSTMSVSAGQTTLQSLDINSNDGSILLSNDQSLLETEVEPKKKDKNVRELSYEFLMQCSKGPYAKQPPNDWDKILKEFPNIVRKSPICWFEPEAHKAKVAAGDFCIISAGDRENETE